jgi:hypothetical protein
MVRLTYSRILGVRVAIFLACMLLVALPAMAQSSGKSKSDSSTQSASGIPERITEQNLVVEGFEPNRILLSKDRYIHTVTTTYMSAGGRPIARGALKAGQVVDIVYLTGGRKTEAYPYQPFEKVLVSVRVVGDGKQR